MILAGLLLQNGPLFSDGTDGIQAKYFEVDLTRTVTGGLVESFGFLLFVTALLFVARQIGTGTEAGRWAAQTGPLCGIAYVAVVFAVGFPAGAVAVYGAQHGLDLETASSPPWAWAARSACPPGRCSSNLTGTRS